MEYPQADIDLEITLVQRVGQGDRAAFEELYERYSAVLLSTAFRILNDQESAEDVLQDVFIQIWDKALMYDPKRGKPLTWAVTMTRNRSIDRLRSKQRRHRLQDDLEKETSIFEKLNDLDSLDSVEAGEKSKIVHEAVMQLTKDQREAIELAFFSGLTQSEIAGRLHEPLGTVKARIRRGMMRLKDLIQPNLE
ncbi:MAG: sigma-70 family RNA polymerase sigma factor [Chthoniobacteraceae bacterium]